MLSKLITAIVFMLFVVAAGGFIVLAVWDTPVQTIEVEKTIGNDTTAP